MSENEEKIVNEVAEGNLDNDDTLPADPIERAEHAAVLSEAIEDILETSDEITLSVSDALLCAEALRVLHVYLHHAAPLHCFMAHLVDAVPLAFEFIPPQADAAQYSSATTINETLPPT